jgi:feruloyl esterase
MLVGGSLAPDSDQGATPQGSQTPLTGLPSSFCRMTGTATPSNDSLINFEIWVPTGSAWNGKLVTTGNDGYSPRLNYGPGLAKAFEKVPSAA